MIRRAEIRDIEAVDVLLYQVHGVHAEGRPDIFKAGCKKYTDEELEVLFRDETRPVFVWTDENDVPRGHAFCVFEETRGVNSLHDMKTLYIDDICVDAGWRHRNIATELYEHVKAFAKDSGCYRVTLNVWELNDGAMKFYQKMGMSPMKTAMEQIL